MSRSVDLFVAADEPPESVAERVSALTGFQLARDTAGRWSVTDGEVSACLDAHPYVDDGNLFLGRYRYAFSAEVPNTIRPQDSAPAALLRQVAQRLQADTSWEVLMVLDLQYRDPGRPQPAMPGGGSSALAQEASAGGVLPVDASGSDDHGESGDASGSHADPAGGSHADPASGSHADPASDADPDPDRAADADPVGVDAPAGVDDQAGDSSTR